MRPYLSTENKNWLFGLYRELSIWNWVYFTSHELRIPPWTNQDSVVTYGFRCNILYIHKLPKLSFWPSSIATKTQKHVPPNRGPVALGEAQVLSSFFFCSEAATLKKNTPQKKWDPKRDIFVIWELRVVTNFWTTVQIRKDWSSLVGARKPSVVPLENAKRKPKLESESIEISSLHDSTENVYLLDFVEWFWCDFWGLLRCSSLVSLVGWCVAVA